jgi:hypothetical protein
MRACEAGGDLSLELVAVDADLHPRQRSALTALPVCRGSAAV